jgi:hypothetical protein
MSETNAVQWKCHPEAEKWLVDHLAEACRQHPAIHELQESLQRETSTRLLDWIDHLSVGKSPAAEHQLHDLGFVIAETAVSYRVYTHPGAKLPAVVVEEGNSGARGVAVLVEQISDFLLARGLSEFIEGSPYSGYRRCCVGTVNGVSLWVVERRGTRTLEPQVLSDDALAIYLEAVEMWKTRPRSLSDEEENMANTLQLAQEIVSLVGRDVAAHVVAEVERDYWQRRNRAAQVQKNRQDRLGMGWANHDHHTFRSSRRHFSALVRLFEILGFFCRERFYAGQEAGWGAQVMENTRAGLVLFLDVDLGEDEVVVDFAHQPLPERQELGTIGLWCALHGDSILQAGMHHLEAQFFFEELTRDLAQSGVQMMQPFSTFTYLKQAFTQGETWPVPPERLAKLAQEKRLSEQQVEKFRAVGAIGSHLENLQRREGYKGFNQKNVSFIIHRTDPRRTTTLQGD